jgi:hypothetical protein
MDPNVVHVGPARSLAPFCQVRIWHLALLVLYVAIAIVDIQDHRRSEPVLIGLAAAGYAGYGLLCWIVWHSVQRFEGRLGRLLLFAVFASVMAAVFLGAVVAYLSLEDRYLGGRL